MDPSLADSETNQLLSLIGQFNRICSDRCLPDTNEQENKQSVVEVNVPDPGHLHQMFLALFGRIYEIIKKLKEFAHQEGVLLEESITSIFKETEYGLINLAELLVRIQTNLDNERKRADDVISYLQNRPSVPTDDPCRNLMEKLKNLESMYTLLKAQLNSVLCELDLKTEQLDDRENEMLELSQRLIKCCTDFENAKNDLLNCENHLKRKTADAAEAKAKCNELQSYADLAVEQTAAAIHERDQSHKLIEHLQSRMQALDRENVTLAGQLKDTERLYSELSLEHTALCAELGRAAEKERETENNVGKIMQECTERVRIEVDRVRETMQRDFDACKAENDRLGLELTEWRLRYEQLQRDYRNIDAMYEQLHSSIACASQNEAAEKAEAIRRAAAAECARDEALFIKQQLALKVEKLELALAKLSERCTNDMQVKQSRIEELQRHVAFLSEDNAKCCHEKGELERELADAKERCIEIDMQYRYKVKTAEDDAKTTMLSCDVKLGTADEAHKKMLNDLARELNARQAIINRMVGDSKRRCGEVEEKLGTVQEQLQEEQARNRELTRVRADQARRISALEDQINQYQRQYESLKNVIPNKK